MKRVLRLEHLLTQRGDQQDAAYRKLNPNGVVPTLVHNGKTSSDSAIHDSNFSC